MKRTSALENAKKNISHISTYALEVMTIAIQEILQERYAKLASNKPQEEKPIKLIVKGICMKGMEGKKFADLDDQTCFTEYVDPDFPKCVKGGYMYFEWSEHTETLYTITEYETTRKLTPEEEKIVIDYTQGQWSDGIGEGFEQRVFSGIEDYNNPDYDESTVVYNPSPWYHGQVAFIEYK